MVIRASAEALAEVVPELVPERVRIECDPKICQCCVESPLTCVSDVTGYDLKQRIEASMNGRVSVRLTPAERWRSRVSSSWVWEVRLRSARKADVSEMC